MLKAALGAAFLLLATEGISQTATDLSAKCDCPIGYDFCSTAIDTLTYKKNFAFTICSKLPFRNNGIHLWHTGVAIKLAGSKRVLFSGADSVDYETLSAKGKLLVLQYLKSYDYRSTTKTSVWSESLPTVVFVVGATGVMDTVFVFPYKKISTEKVTGILNAYKTELARLKSDDKYIFSFDVNLSQLLLAALNNSQEAKKIIRGLSATLKTKMKGKVMYVPDENSDKQMLQHCIEIIRLQEKLK